MYHKIPGMDYTENDLFLLQGSNVSGKGGRVHCSLNINTETGRLSARRPNLQVHFSFILFSAIILASI